MSGYPCIPGVSRALLGVPRTFGVLLQVVPGVCGTRERGRAVALWDKGVGSCVSIEGVVNRIEPRAEEEFPGVEAEGLWAVSPGSIRA